MTTDNQATTTTSAGGKATRIRLFNFSSPQMRAFHLSWLAFFFCFFAWFALAPLTATVRKELNLTPAQVGNIVIASVAITILARLLVGWSCDRFGPRLTYTVLLMVGALPVMSVGLAHDYTTFLLFRLAIGAIGASFVITQYHTSMMFAPNCVGTANAAAAGWGNMGGGVAQLLMPLLFTALIGLGFTSAASWRLAMILPGAAMLLTGVAYYFLTQDLPAGNVSELRRRGLQIGKSKPGSGMFWMACKDGRVWALAMIYGGCFGVEITIHNVASLYFTDRFGFGISAAGAVVGAFGMLALFARALGGIISDRISRSFGLNGRVAFLGAAMLCEGILLVVFSTMSQVPLAVASLILFGLFVHIGCGATYAVIPFVNKKAVGSVAGIVGAGGNVGAVLSGLLFKGAIAPNKAFMFLGVIVAISSFASLCIRFSTDDALHDDFIENTEKAADANKDIDLLPERPRRSRSSFLRSFMRTQTLTSPPRTFRLQLAPTSRAHPPHEPSPSSARPLTLIDEFLAKQADLTAVERFAKRHDSGDVPHQRKYYQDLIPLTLPKSGQQYAFEVDLDACSGCKACVVACHNLNGLDEDETWRSVGLLTGGSASSPVIQHVTTACHHCVEPACMDGCPVLAYEKDEVTGIVRHLDDQCIGCQYCVLKCPYDVPKYNKSKGIVRKCDMCSSRLENGEAPACVQSCPNSAIKIKIVNKADVIAESEARTFLPGAADPDYTLPTTHFKSSRPLPRNTLPADYYRVAPQHAHMPLVFMLVLTQLSAGAFLFGRLAMSFLNPSIVASFRSVHATVALLLGIIALGASTLHLGRPLYAFRAVLGLRTSWLSREIVVFAIFAKLAVVYAVCCWTSPSWLTATRLSALGSAVAITGLAGVFCSVMIYHDTRRVFWRARHTATKFFLSVVILGPATTQFVTLAASIRLPADPSLSRWIAALSLVTASGALLKIAFGLLVFLHLRKRGHSPMKRTAILLAGPLRSVVASRLVLAVIGGILLPLLIAAQLQGGAISTPLRILSFVSLVVIVVSELMERYLFFAAVVAPQMPGGPGV